MKNILLKLIKLPIITIYGKTKKINIFATIEEWVKIEGIYDKKAFITTSKLCIRYKKNLQSLTEIYYSTTMIEVIT